MFNPFDNRKYVKVLESDWELLKRVVANDKATIDTLRLVQSPVLKRQVQELNDEIEQLRKYKRNDDLIYAWEENNKDSNKRIKRLEEENEELRDELKKTKAQLEREKGMVSLFAKNYIKQDECSNMRIASAFEVYA